MKRHTARVWIPAKTIGWSLALLPVLTALFFDRGTTTIFEPDKLALFRALVLLLVGWQSSLIVLGLQPAPHRWPLALPALALLGVAVLATLFSIAPRWSVWGSYERGQGVLTLLAFIAYACLVHGYRASYPLEEWIPRAVVLGSVAVVLYALAQAADLDPLDWQVEAGSFPVFGTLGRSNYLAAFLVMAMPLTAGWLAVSRERWQRWGLGGLLLAQALALLLTRSRGGWLALGAAVSVATVAWGTLRRARHWVVGGVSLAVLGIALLLALNLAARAGQVWAEWPLLERLASLHQTDAGSTAARVTIWRASLRLIGRRPLLGHGPGTFAPAFARVYPPELIYYQGRQTMVDRAHNEWLNLGVEMGGLGLAAAVWLQAVVWIGGLRRLRALSQPDRQAWQLGLLVSLLANGLLGLVSPPTAAPLILSWALYSLVLPPPAAVPGDRRRRSGQETPRRPWAAASIGLLALAGAGWLYLRPAIAEHAFARGLRRGDVAMVARAQRWVPGQDVYFHQGGRLAAEVGGPEGLAQVARQMAHATDLCPVQPLYWADLGTVYLAWSAQDPARLAQAEAAFEAALAISPRQPLFLRGLGQVYLAAGRYAEAEATLRRVVGLDATDGQAYASLGDLYYAEERHEEAALAYMYGRDLWPGSPIPLAGLGRAYRALGRCEDAVIELERSLSMGSSGPLTFVALADCQARLGDASAAAEIVRQGLRLYPGNEELQAASP
jgi:O-antigen ligase/tetratricopeptide (TPR) repeat protein